MGATRSAARDQAGFMIPLVVMVMTVVGMLAGAALLAADASNGGANDDRRSKRALAAAESGLQEAAFRLNALRPDRTKCLSGTGPTYAGTPVGGECPAVAGTTTSAATYAYHGTPELPAGAGCADLPNVAADSTASDHCVTSTGTSGGIKRRVQARVRVPRQTIFNAIGLLGLDYVKLINSDKIFSDVGSNGLVNGVNSVEIDRSVFIPQSAPAPVINGSNPPIVRRPAPWSLPQVGFDSSFATNNNANLVGWGSRYNAPARTVTLDNSVEYTLTSGTYNLCDFYADNSVKLKVQNNATRIKLFIDSPDRPGSNCAAGTGRFCLDNSVEFNKDPGASDQAARVEIFVYGTSARCSDGRPGLPFDGTQIPSIPAHAPVVMNNSVTFYGTVYAPTSRVILTNSIKMYGGIASVSIDLGNSIEFTHPNSVRNQTPAPGDIKRLTWVECRPAPTTLGDPESGCA